MKSKFLIAVAPLVATAAFIAVPAAAQAAPCWQTSAGGPCITENVPFTATLSSANTVLTGKTSGLEITSTDATLVGEALPGGASTIEASEWSDSTINLPAPCAAEVVQTSDWTDQLGGSAGGYTDTVTVPSGEGHVTVSGCTGELAAFNGEYAFAGAVTAPVASTGTGSSLAFSATEGLVLTSPFGPEATTFTGTFGIPGLFVSES